MLKKSKSNRIETKVKYKYIFIKRFLSQSLRYIRLSFKKSRFDYKMIPNLLIETTNVCLSKCIFCAYQYMQRPKQHLDMNIFKKAVDEYIQMGGTSLNLCTILGDPTCDPYLLERINYIKKYPKIKALGFVTTLQNLHNFDIAEFVNSGITWLSISTTLSGKIKYYELFGVDLYDQALKNLISLLTENQRCKNKVNITIDIKPTNEPKENIMNHSDFKLINSLVKQDLVTKVKDIYYFVDDWCDAVNLPRYLKRRPLYPRFFRPCQLLINAVIIFSNGNVGACACRDYNADSDLILGNLKENNLKELLQGDKRFKFYSNWLKYNKIPKLCKKCRHYNY